MLRQPVQDRTRRKPHDRREKPLFFSASERLADGAVNAYTDQDFRPRWWPGELPVPLSNAKK